MVGVLCVWRFPDGNHESMNCFNFYHRMNFPRRRAPRMMKSVAGTGSIPLASSTLIRRNLPISSGGYRNSSRNKSIDFRQFEIARG